MIIFDCSYYKAHTTENESICFKKFLQGGINSLVKAEDLAKDLMSDMDFNLVKFKQKFKQVTGATLPYSKILDKVVALASPVDTYLQVLLCPKGPNYGGKSPVHKCEANNSHGFTSNLVGYFNHAFVSHFATENSAIIHTVDDDWAKIEKDESVSMLLALEFNLICVNSVSGSSRSKESDDDIQSNDGIDDVNDVDFDDEPGEYCCDPLNDGSVDEILRELNKFIILLLQKIGCQIKAVQLFGSQAGTLSKEFTGIANIVQSMFHPAVVQRSLNGQINEGNVYQCRAIKSFLAEIIRTHPFHSKVKDHKSVFDTFKKDLVEDQSAYSYLFDDNLTALTDTNMDIREALSRFTNQNWNSNIKKTTYDLESAQVVTSSTHYEEGRNFILPQRHNYFKKKTKLGVLYEPYDNSVTPELLLDAIKYRYLFGKIGSAMHLGLIKLQDRERRNSQKLKKTDFGTLWMGLSNKLKELNPNSRVSLGEIIFQRTATDDVSNKLSSIHEWKVIFIVNKSNETIQSIYPIFPKLSRPSEFNFSTELGSKIHQKHGLEWILERFCFFSLVDLKGGLDAATADVNDTSVVNDSVVDVPFKKYGLLNKTDELMKFFDSCRSKCPSNSKQLMPLSMEIKKNMATFALNNPSTGISVAYESNLPGLVFFLLRSHIDRSIPNTLHCSVINLALESVKIVYSKDESPNAMSAQSKRSLHSEIMFESFKSLQFTDNFPYKPIKKERLYLPRIMDTTKEAEDIPLKRKFLEVIEGKVFLGSFVKESADPPASYSNSKEETCASRNFFSPLVEYVDQEEPWQSELSTSGSQDVDPSKSLLTDAVVKTFKIQAEERVDVLTPGAITHTLEMIVENNDEMSKVFQDNTSIYNYARCIFGAMCKFRELFITVAMTQLMGENVKFCFEKLCFFKDCWRQTKAIDLEDFIKIKELIIQSIQKSPAVAVLYILKMMDQKEKECKYLYLMLQDFNSKESKRMTFIEKLNLSRKNHEMSIKNERVHLLVNYEGQVYFWCINSKVKEEFFRQELLKVLLSTVLPANISKIIRDKMAAYPQWYADKTEKGLWKFIGILEKSFKDNDMYANLEAQHETKYKIEAVIKKGADDCARTAASFLKSNSSDSLKTQEIELILRAINGDCADHKFSLFLTASEKSLMEMLLSRQGEGCIITIIPKSECSLFKNVLSSLVARNHINSESFGVEDRKRKEDSLKFDIFDALNSSNAISRQRWFFSKGSVRGRKAAKNSSMENGNDDDNVPDADVEADKKQRKGDFYWGEHTSRKLDYVNHAYDLDNLLAAKNGLVTHLIDNLHGNSTIWQACYKSIRTEVNNELDVSIKAKGKRKSKEKNIRKRMEMFNRRYFFDGVLLPEMFAKDRAKRPVNLNTKTTRWKFLNSDEDVCASKCYTWDVAYCTTVGSDVLKYQIKITDVQLQLGGKSVTLHAKKPAYYCFATSESCKKFGTDLKYINFEVCQPMFNVDDLTTILIPLKIFQISSCLPDKLSNLKPISGIKSKHENSGLKSDRWKVSMRKRARAHREAVIRKNACETLNPSPADENGRNGQDKKTLEFGVFYPLYLVCTDPVHKFRLPKNLCLASPGQLSLLYIRMNGNIPSPKQHVESSSFFADPNEKGMLTGTTALGDVIQTENNGSIKLYQDRISSLQSAWDKEIETDTAVKKSKERLQEMEDKYFDKLLKTTTDLGSLSQMEAQISLFKKELSRVRSAARIQVNNDSLKRQQPMIDLQKVLSEPQKEYYQAISPKRLACPPPSKTYDQEITGCRLKIQHFVSRLHQAIKLLAIHFRIFASSRYIARGKMSCLKFAKLWNTLARTMSICDDDHFILHADEGFSTGCCPCCGTYSPPGRSRQFHCSNPKCHFKDARDPKSCVYYFLSTVAKAKMEGSPSSPPSTTTTAADAANAKGSSSKKKRKLEKDQVKGSKLLKTEETTDHFTLTPSSSTQKKGNIKSIQVETAADFDRWRTT